MGLKAIDSASPSNAISISSVACASSPTPASSVSAPGLKAKRSGTVLSATNATLRTESTKGATSTTAVALRSEGSRCRYGGKVPSSILDVITFPSLAKPISRSVAVAAASATLTLFAPAKDFAASFKVRARISADALARGASQFNSRTAKRYLSVAAKINLFSSIST